MKALHALFENMKKTKKDLATEMHDKENIRLLRARKDNDKLFLKEDMQVESDGVKSQEELDAAAINLGGCFLNTRTDKENVDCCLRVWADFQQKKQAIAAEALKNDEKLKTELAEIDNSPVFNPTFK